MKLGMIGSGRIVEAALDAVQPLPEIRVTALFARPHSRPRGEALALRHGIPAVYTDYAALLEKADVDTVYIGLINSAHYAYARQALESKKHVILEKPFTGTLAQAQALFDLAAAQGCFLFEAITVPHHPVVQRMRETLPHLGPIRLMLANYSQYSSRYDGYLAGAQDPSLDPACLGGALRDLNVYNLHYAVCLFGPPRRARYCPNVGWNGVDTSGVVILEYGGFVCVCAGAKDSDSPCFVSVQGEKGFMRVEGKPNLAPELVTVLSGGGADGAARDAAGAALRATATERFVPPPAPHRMTREFADFARAIREKDRPYADSLARETLEVMKILDACAASFPADVS